MGQMYEKRIVNITKYERMLASFCSRIQQTIDDKVPAVNHENIFDIIERHNLSKLRKDECKVYYAQNGRSNYISDLFRKKSNIRFFKNFIRGLQCGNCFVRNKILYTCKG